MVYARRPTRPKPRKSESAKFNAPIVGWISNRMLSDPQSALQGPGAAVLDNMFPRASSVSLRRGKETHADIGNGSEDVESLFAYNNGTNRSLFAAIPSAIYDITIASSPELMRDGNTNGRWIAAQFATTGQVYLLGVNGDDEAFIYDGQDFFPWLTGGVTSITYTGASAAFTPGQVVTGGTSGATGTVVRATSPTSGTP